MSIYGGVYITLAAIVIQVSCDCGIVSPPANPLDTIEDGSDADIFSWHVIIYVVYPGGFLQKMCPGTLISSDVVITAARCVITQGVIHLTQCFVVTGNYTPLRILLNDTIQKHRLKTVYRMEGYDEAQDRSAGHTAWIVLQQPLNISPSLRPACVDFEKQQDVELQTGLVGMVIYRANMEDAAGLKFRKMEIVPSSDAYCYFVFPQERRQNPLLNPSCAQLSTENPSPMNDMIGSGFYSQRNGRWYLRGIVTDVFVYVNGNIRKTVVLLMNIERYGLQLKRNGILKRCGEAAFPVNPLIANGFKTELGRFPWHVGIYRKSSTDVFDQICAGTLISTKMVISAAHCFYNDVESRQEAASKFFVAAGKLYRSYNWPEKFVQKSEVESIHLPDRYYGIYGNYAEDIAWLILQHPFYQSAVVKQICVDFDNVYRGKDFQVGRVGKVAGWGRTAAGVMSIELQEMNVPFVPHATCVSVFPQDFIPFVTSDKFCAGYLNGTSVCDGDSGGGLIFRHDGFWYLRGIVSVAPSSGESTCPHSYTVFTHVGHFNDEHRRILNISLYGSN